MNQMERMNKLSLMRNYMMNNSFVNNVKSYSGVIFSERFKNFFGKEYNINGFGSVSQQSQPFYDFLERVIPNFAEKYIDNNNSIKDIIHFSKIDSGTFIYIATGFYTPGTAHRIFMNQTENAGCKIYIYILGRKSQKYVKMLDKCLENIDMQMSSMNILMINGLSSRDSDTNLVGFNPRGVDSMVYSNNEIDHIIEHIDRFMNNMEFYKQKQLNYKTGVLLYGEPGTGKSTIIKILATKYKRNIVQINVSNISRIDFAELTMLLNNDTNNHYIVLLEDIDTLYLQRQKAAEEAKNKKKDKDEEEEDNYNSYHQVSKPIESSFNDLLQFLDSSVSPNNVIFVATTNHINILDDALLRDGRFDLKEEIKGIKEADIHRFCEIFEVDYDTNIENIKSEYGKPKKGLYNQSKLQNILLKLK